MFFSPLFHTRKWFFKKVYKKSYNITDMKKLKSLERVHVPHQLLRHNHWKYSFKRNRFLSCVKLIRGESFGRRKKRFALKKDFFFHFNTWKKKYVFFTCPSGQNTSRETCFFIGKSLRGKKKFFLQFIFFFKLFFQSVKKNWNSKNVLSLT